MCLKKHKGTVQKHKGTSEAQGDGSIVLDYSYDTTDTNFDTIPPMMYVELCRVMKIKICITLDIKAYVEL